MQVSLDAALGGAFEKLRGRAVTSSGALRAAQTLTWKPTPTATLSQGASALWKLGDFGDAFYRLDAGCALSMSKRLELKLTLQSDFKTRPPDPRIQKRDDVLITALVFKL